MRRILILTSALLVFVTWPHSQALSQQAAAPATATAETPAQPAIPATAPQQDPVPEEAPQTTYVFDSSKYVPPTFENLAKLYWTLGVLDINDSETIDNYLAITDCDLYTSYINDDMEWPHIRDLARESIRKNYKTFPTLFKVTIPLYLRQYHYDEEYFDVDMDKSAINAVRRIETLFHREPLTCRRSGEFKGYPKNITLFLNRPFSLSELPVERELAKLYLDEVTSQKKLLSYKMKQSEGERLAFLEIMFKVHTFKEVVNTQVGLQAVVYTQIDHIRVYADIEQEKLLYQQSMYEDAKRKRARRQGATTDDALNLPDGPIFNELPKKKN